MQRDLFEAIASFPALSAAARRASLGKHAKPGVAAFLANQEREVLRLERQLRNGSYRPGHYKTLEIFDPKHRIVSAAPFRDRVVHHALCAVCEPTFGRSFIFDSYANRKGKGTHRAVARYERFRDRFRYVLRCDVYRYFPAIDHEILKRDLRRRIGCQQTLWLVDRIIDASNPQEPVTVHYPGDGLSTPWERRRGLPIGNLTSQFFANVYLDCLDHFCKEALRAKGYLRYVDDFALFHDDADRLEEWRRLISRYLEGRRLRLHPRKTLVAATEEPAKFLGFVLLPGGQRRLPEDNVSRFRSRLRGLRDARAPALSRVATWINTSLGGSPMPNMPIRGACAVRSFLADGSIRRGGLTAPLSVRLARRLLEQQTEEPPVGESQQELYRKPQPQQRVPYCQHAPVSEPASLRGRRERR